MQAASEAKFWATTQPLSMAMPARLDSGTAPDMELNARNFIQSGAQDLVLDGSDLTYLTSTGLHAILTIAKLMQNVQGKVSVSNLSGQPLDMFLACGYGQTIPLRDDATAEAIAA